MTAKAVCAAEHPVTHGRCQLPAGHAEGHVFPIDDAFMDALDDGLLVIGRPGSFSKKPPAGDPGER